MYSAKVLEHLQNPRNTGELDDATMRGEATNPVCGDLLRLHLKIADGRITAARFTVLLKLKVYQVEESSP